MIFIIMDTNFALIPMMFHVDIFSEIKRICDFPYQLCILDRSLDELNNIKTKEKKFIKPTMALLKTKGVEILKTTNIKHVDALLIETAKGYNAIVATQDIPLRKSLKREKIPVIYMRQKKYLEITRDVL